MRRIEKRGAVNVLCDDDGNGCMPATRAEIEFYAEIARLRAEAEALRADAATDRKLVQAAEKFIQPVLQELQFERGHGSLAVHNLRLVLIEAMKANAKHAEIDAARAAQGDKT